jgi:hypothetical protein
VVVQLVKVRQPKAFLEKVEPVAVDVVLSTKRQALDYSDRQPLAQLTPEAVEAVAKAVEVLMTHRPSPAVLD